ncbi:MAG: type II toxin-antitoxin system RelE/ParE family toxin [Candidatus Marinimicrobia bacterium]|nr:type II toxin-antitoxin system RelE/ParE family toxin [Candidatus Neomarinimicrobiota bacterium]
MRYLLSNPAVKTLKGLTRRVAENIIAAIEELPEKGDNRRLKGKRTPPLWRLRVGKYRIIYQRSDSVIRILKIDTRGDVYKHL